MHRHLRFYVLSINWLSLIIWHYILYPLIVFVLKTTLFHVEATLAFNCLVVAQQIFFHSFIFVSYLKWVLYSTSSGDCLFVHFNHVCLFIGVFRPLTYIVIIDTVRLKYTTLQSIFYLSHMFFICIFLFLIVFHFLSFIGLWSISLFCQFRGCFRIYSMHN